MTDDTTQQLNGVHRRQRRVRWQAIALAAVAAALLAFTVGTFVQAGQEKEQQTSKAVSAAEQLCAQVEALGGLCVVDPDDLRGEPGAAGPPGPPPTDEQVQEAVNLFLLRNPPQPGRPPTMQEIADAVAIQLAATPPERGERGPGPTPEQIAGAVASFLLANPPPAGEPGQDGADGQDSTVPGPIGEPGEPGEPPLSWTFTSRDVLGQPTTHRCERDEPFDPDAPTYTCTEQEEGS